MANVEIRGITDLDRAIKNKTTKEARAAIRKGLRQASKIALAAAKSKSPSSRVATYLRQGSTSLFRSSKGNIQLRSNSVGNLGFTAVGVPGPFRVPPTSNRRAWFVAYSLEKGNPGSSSRAQRRGRYVRHQVARPFILNAVKGASSQIVAAFENAARSELGL